ncbi:hypothetical protein G7Z17_g6810 [Cylindrodendrum hubeiense]|uniref:Secreted protein n=1 Tax=Cylindrodendrum hubeiense TaxID=595255 RepID=A0A9P5HEF2_9HYPO|nr:hypothetical protein G7Z17_g6810 [Cylindrodendrum hubeiense]
MSRLFFSTLLGLVASSLVLGHDSNDHGTFSHPASRVRPRFRYWLPDASVDADVVIKDIESAASIGAGGVEFLPFFEYGGQIGRKPPGADWSAYGFGTPPFVDLFEKALKAHEKEGLVMDFALGPNQGQGVPAHPDNEGLQWDMVPFTEEIPARGSFNNKIPGWGTGSLVSLVTALVKSNQSITYAGVGLFGVQNVTYNEYRLSHKTLKEVTGQVDQRGYVKLSLPQAPKGSHYRLFAFYEKLTGHKNLNFSPTEHGTIFDNGSYAVDHFSAKGAAVVSAFWEEHILKGEVPGLLAKVGNYAWEDSIELTYNGTTPGPYKCILDSEDEGIGYINDFRATLVDGYNEYLTAMADWVHDVLDVQLSAQPVYGSAMDALAAVPSVDAPECESLGFEDKIDSYRSFSGPARLSGKRIISNEMGAVRGSGFQFHLPHLVFSVNRAFLGGVNQMVLHGQSYSGTYYATTWPGHTPFNYLFSEPFSPNLPSWSHGLKETMDYIGRNQHILQESISKADVVIYNKESSTTIRNIYQATDLLTEGWSWNYISADNLGLEQTVVKNRVLAPDGPAWKAFVVESSQNLTLEAVKTLRSLARDRLPVIISGGLPAYYSAGDRSDKAEFETELSKLLRSQNVYSIAHGHVADKLKSLGLRPQIQLNTNGTCYTSWSEAGKVGYAITYSDLVRSTGSITVNSIKMPFYLNAWTGETTPVLVYKRDRSTTTIPVNLSGNQTLIIAFGDGLQKQVPVPRYHIEKVPSNVLGTRFISGRGISLHVAQSNNPSQAVLSNGKRVALDAAVVPSAFRLSKWGLTVEHWEAPEDHYDSENTFKYNTTHRLEGLTSWSDIPALVNASGIGYYTTTFQWPPSGTQGGSKSLGAYIGFSKVIDAIRVSINGHKVPPLDITNAVADISPYLREGKNSVVATVPTTLWNYIRTVITELETAGSKPLPVTLQQYGLPLAGRTEAGLVETVTITPYKIVVV